MTNRMHPQKYARHLGEIAHRTELAELEALPALLDEVKHFVDVGASYGPYTWVAVYALENARITAIEANPSLCAHLGGEWANIRSGGEHRGNELRVVNCAVSNLDAPLNFLVNKGDYSTSKATYATDRESHQGEYESVSVQGVTLDSMFAADPPDLIKLDVEGNEWRALDGARSVLQAGQTRFLVEIHPWGDESLRKTPRHVFQLFREYGYGVRRVNHHWYFVPGKPGFIEGARSRVYGWACEQPVLRKMARVALSLGR